MAKTQGISAEEAAKQVGYANQQALMSGKISLSTKDILAAQTSSLNKLTGTSVQFSGEMATQFAHIQDRLKLSAESMGVFASNALRGKGDVNSQMQDISNINYGIKSTKWYNYEYERYSRRNWEIISITTS